MFGIGGLEFVVLCIIAIVLVGPKQLPTVVGQAGHWIRKISRLRDDWVREIKKDPSVQEITRSFEEAREPIHKIRRELEMRRRELQETLEEHTEQYSAGGPPPVDVDKRETQTSEVDKNEVTEIIPVPSDEAKKP
jgi:sec-independent protein translocase protein TatB